MTAAVLVAAVVIAAASPAEPGASSGASGIETPVLVDLNQADLSTLCSLPGIGPKKAEAIITLRRRRPLTRLTQLLLVRGIGPRMLERLRGRVTLRPPVVASRPAPETTTRGTQVASRYRSGTIEP